MDSVTKFGIVLMCCGIALMIFIAGYKLANRPKAIEITSYVRAREHYVEWDTLSLAPDLPDTCITQILRIRAREHYVEWDTLSLAPDLPDTCITQILRIRALGRTDSCKIRLVR